MSDKEDPIDRSNDFLRFLRDQKESFIQLESEIEICDHDDLKWLYNKTICKIRVDDFCDMVRPTPMFDKKVHFLKEYVAPNSIVQLDNVHNINFVQVDHTEKENGKTICLVKVDDSCQIVRPLNSKGEVVPLQFKRFQIDEPIGSN